MTDSSKADLEVGRAHVEQVVPGRSDEIIQVSPLFDEHFSLVFANSNERDGGRLLDKAANDFVKLCQTQGLLLGLTGWDFLTAWSAFHRLDRTA